MFVNRLVVARAHISSGTSGWALAAGASVVALVVLLAGYWQTVESLVWVWAHDGTYQYAFLIFPLSLWTAFSLRHRLTAAPPKPSVWGLPAVALLAFVWYAGHTLDVNLPQHAALVAFIPALVLAFWGWRALGVLAFPLGYLVFAVPWGDGLVGPLQDITAHFAVRALELTGTPVLLNGREIVTPSTVWMVADACSGVKFFIACTALGCLYAYLMYRRWWKRVLFVALAAVVPVIANGLRVYFTVLIGETWGLKYATGTDHLIFGWQFFGTVLVLLLLVGWLFRDRLLPEEDHPRKDGRVSWGRMSVWFASLVLLTVAPIASARFALAAATPQAIVLAAPAIPGWNGPGAPQGDWHPTFVGATSEVQATYRVTASGARVEFFHAVYTGKPRAGHNLITYGNDVYDPASQRILSAAHRRVQLADGVHLSVSELRLAGDNSGRLVWYWYCVGHRCTASPVVTKLWQAWEVLRGMDPISSVWALSAPVLDQNTERARTQLAVFVKSLPPAAGGGRTSQDRTVPGIQP